MVKGCSPVIALAALGSGQQQHWGSPWLPQPSSTLGGSVMGWARSEGPPQRWSKVVAGAANVVSGGIDVAVGHTCCDSGDRRHHGC